MKPSRLPRPDLPAQTSLAASVWARLCALWGGVSVTRRTRSLRLCESLPLGEKRLLALVECEGQRLLLSVTAERIALIERLGAVSDSVVAAHSEERS